MTLEVVVLTSDKRLWAVQPFAYLYETYVLASWPVTVVGFTHPQFPLPPNFHFHSISDKPYPAERWSDALIEFLKTFEPKLFILLLEDYFLIRFVDTIGINTLADYMAMHPEVLRLDLTTDRLYAGGMFDVECWGHYDIIETPEHTPYQMSLQAGIWNKDHLFSLLVPGKTPWEVEVQTSPPASMRVLGTRQWPMRFVNAFKAVDPGQPDKPLNLEGIVDEHLQVMAKRGWLSR